MPVKVKLRNVFCAVCAAEREIASHTIPWRDFVNRSVGVGLLVGSCFSFFHDPIVGLWSGSGGALVTFLIFEVFHHLKFRREIRCPVCYFSPLLYRQNPEAAKKECLEHLKSREGLISSGLRKRQESSPG